MVDKYPTTAGTQDSPAPKYTANKLNDSVVAQGSLQYESGIKYRKFRQSDWHANEDLYFNRSKPALRSRFDVSLPIMGGFIDTLISKTDEDPVVVFGHLKDADIRAAKKNTAYWEYDTSSLKTNWKGADKDARKIAALYGRAIYFNYAESDPRYKSYRELLDVYDFFCDPIGGKYLENHRFLGQDNVFKTIYELETSSLYDPAQVRLLKANDRASASTPQNAGTQDEKKNRLAGLGISGDWGDYTGDALYRLIQMGTTYKGVRYWVVFEAESKIWLQVTPMTEFHGDKDCDLWPWTSWATHPDRFNFWSKAPADDMRTGCESIRVLFNQALDNRQKKNWGNRAYDEEVYTNPQLLEYRPDGLIPAKVPAGKSMQDTIYEFKVADLNDTVNLVQIIDNILGTKTGITASVQGQTDKDAKVGIYYGDLKQVSDRLSYLNDNKTEETEQAALLWSWGIWKHLPETEMVKVVGDKGIEWDRITKEDTSPDFSITFKGGMANAQMDELKKKNKEVALMSLRNDPNYALMLNKRLAAEFSLQNAGWEEADIKRLLDAQSDANEKSISRAAQARDQILMGKKPMIYYSADSTFLQVIADTLEDELKPEQVAALQAYFNSHIPIVMRNMARKAKFAALIPATLARPTPNAPMGPEIQPRGPQEPRVPGVPIMQ